MRDSPRWRAGASSGEAWRIPEGRPLKVFKRGRNTPRLLSVKTSPLGCVWRVDGQVPTVEGVRELALSGPRGACCSCERWSGVKGERGLNQEEDTGGYDEDSCAQSEGKGRGRVRQGSSAAGTGKGGEDGLLQGLVFRETRQRRCCAGAVWRLEHRGLGYRPTLGSQWLRNADWSLGLQGKAGASLGLAGPGGTSPFEQEVVERQSVKETKVEAQEGGKETRRVWGHWELRRVCRRSGSCSVPAVTFKKDSEKSSGLETQRSLLAWQWQWGITVARAGQEVGDQERGSRRRSSFWDVCAEAS